MPRLPTTPTLADEDLWQWNVFAGWRLARRRVELAVGLVNVTDQDFRLNPLSFVGAPERERTFVSRLSWRF